MGDRILQQTLQTEEEQQIFLGFRFLKQEQKETTNKAIYFWIFQISNRK
jgi:hypothetical protein